MSALLKNCPKCGKIFHFMLKPICEDCIKLDEDMFERVRQHLKDNPGLSLMSLAKETGVDSKKILRYVKEGRLELLHAEIECEKCNTKISAGRFCKECVDKLGKQAFSALQKLKNESSAAAQKGRKMFTDRSDKEGGRRTRS